MTSRVRFSRSVVVPSASRVATEWIHTTAIRAMASDTERTNRTISRWSMCRIQSGCRPRSGDSRRPTTMPASVNQNGMCRRPAASSTSFICGSTFSKNRARGRSRTAGARNPAMAAAKKIRMGLSHGPAHASIGMSIDYYFVTNGRNLVENLPAAPSPAGDQPPQKLGHLRRILQPIIPAGRPVSDGDAGAPAAHGAQEIRVRAVVADRDAEVAFHRPLPAERRHGESLVGCDGLCLDRAFPPHHPQDALVYGGPQQAQEMPAHGPAPAGGGSPVVEGHGEFLVFDGKRFVRDASHACENPADGRPRFGRVDQKPHAAHSPRAL